MWVLCILYREKNGKCLYTCSVRPAAIYGPGEERHLPRIVNLAKLGLLPFKIGESSVKTDWVYVDNLVLALIMASMGLLDEFSRKGSQPVAAGQSYFISDGKILWCSFLRLILSRYLLQCNFLFYFVVTIQEVKWIN